MKPEGRSSLITILLALGLSVAEAGNFSPTTTILNETASAEQLFGRRIAVVAAHLDDDVLFMPGFLEGAEAIYIVAHPLWPNYEALVERFPEWYRHKLHNLAGKSSSWEEWEHKWKRVEARGRYVNKALIKARLADQVCSGQVDVLITHAPWGDYQPGHPHHVLTYQAAKEVALECGLDMWAATNRYDAQTGENLGSHPDNMPTVSVCMEQPDRFWEIYRAYQQYDAEERGFQAWTWYSPGTPDRPEDTWAHGHGQCASYAHVIDDAINLSNADWDYHDTYALMPWHQVTGCWDDAEDVYGHR